MYLPMPRAVLYSDSVCRASAPACQLIGYRMEVEAKFAVPDRRTFLRLAALRNPAGYTLGTRTVQVADQYLDTGDGRLLRPAILAGCDGSRTKSSPRSKGWATLAAPSTSGTSRKSSCPSGLPIPPPGPPARRVIWRCVSPAGRPCTPVRAKPDPCPLGSHGRRTPRRRWSLDAVSVPVGERPAHYYELEVELKDAGTEDDLQALAAEFSGRWRLSPQARSKFQRGYEIYLAYRQTLQARLTPAERSALPSMPPVDRFPGPARPATVLGWAEGLPSHEIAARAGLSRQRALFWLRSFRTRRLAIFREGTGRARRARRARRVEWRCAGRVATPAAPVQSNDVDPEVQAAAVSRRSSAPRVVKPERAAKAAAAQAAASAAAAAAAQATAPEAPGDNARAFRRPPRRRLMTRQTLEAKTQSPAGPPPCLPKPARRRSRRLRPRPNRPSKNPRRPRSWPTSR